MRLPHDPITPEQRADQLLDRLCVTVSGLVVGTSTWIVPGGIDFSEGFMLSVVALTAWKLAAAWLSKRKEA